MDILVTFDRKDYQPDWPLFDRTAGRSVIRRGDLYAMTYSSAQGYYKFPGGGMNPGETPVEAMIRETKEETGLIVISDSVRPLGIVKEKRKGLKEPEIFSHTSYFYFADAEEQAGETQPEGYEIEENIELRWVTLEEALRETEPRLEHMRGDFLRRETFVMRYILENDL